MSDDEIARLRIETKRLRMENYRLRINSAEECLRVRAERDSAQAKYSRAIAILTAIHRLLYPPRVEHEGKIYEFNYPGDAPALLQELSDLIRAIPDELEVLMSDDDILAVARQHLYGTQLDLPWKVEALLRFANALIKEERASLQPWDGSPPAATDTVWIEPGRKPNE
jgi:hypothetical protein